MTPEAHIVFQSIPNFMQILEMQQNIQQILFDFEIIAFALVKVNTRF